MPTPSLARFSPGTETHWCVSTWPYAPARLTSRSFCRQTPTGRFAPVCPSESPEPAVPHRNRDQPFALLSPCFGLPWGSGGPGWLLSLLVNKATGCCRRGVLAGSFARMCSSPHPSARLRDGSRVSPLFSQVLAGRPGGPQPAAALRSDRGLPRVRQSDRVVRAQQRASGAAASARDTRQPGAGVLPLARQLRCRSSLWRREQLVPPAARRAVSRASSAAERAPALGAASVSCPAHAQAAGCRGVHPVGGPATERPATG